MENKETQEKKESNYAFTTFIDALERGQSFLQEPNKEPSYVKNLFTGKPLTDVNMLTIMQGLKDNNCQANLVVTRSQMENHKNDKGYDEPLWAKKGTKSLGTALYENFNATYHKDDEEVKNGNAKIGQRKMKADGTPEDLYTPSFIYAAENVIFTKYELQKDENGNQLYHENDVLSKDKIYEEDKHYDALNRDVKKGDPVIINFKGTKVGKTLPTEKTLVPAQKTHFPPLIENNDIAPLYKRKNDSAKEILTEKLTEAFRGKMQGNFNGIQFTQSEINIIKKEFADSYPKFKGVCKVSWQRAEGDKKTVAEIDAAILAKENKASNENNKENININQNVKSKGRK